MPKINKIKLSGTSYDIQDSNASKTVTLTQAQYDALQTKDPNTFYIISDGETFDPSEKVDTSAFTAYSASVETALSGKAAQSDLNTLSGTVTGHTADTTIHVTASDKATWNAKSDFSGDYNDLTNKLSAGTNITIVDNVISAEGGGKAVSAGTNISITTGETADTINCTLSGGTLINISNNKINCAAPIRYGTGNNSVIVGSSISTNKATGMNSIANGGDANTASGQYSFAEGFNTQSTKNSSHSEGWFTLASGNYSHTEGNHTKTTNESEHASGKYNVSSSASTTFGDSGNTLFSVGNGTADNARHNAFEIRQNGDIYLTLDGQDVKLQDQLGGGGGITSGEVQTMIDESISGKTDESAFTTHTADTTIHVTSAEKATWNAKSDFSGDYNDLTNKLSAGTNITIVDNVISAEGGGGKAVTAGTNISVTTGETADTINCTLPITATSSAFNTISVGANSGGGSYNTLIGPNARCDNSYGHNVFLVAQNSSNSSQGAYVNGTHNVIIGSIANGYLNFNMPSFTTSNSVVIGGGGISTDKNKSVAIGYQANVSGTTQTNINNQLKIDTSNQVYIYNKDNTEMICLQDQLGGGGGSSVVELTQAEYDALTTIDPDTIYVITDAAGGDLSNYYTKAQINAMIGDIESLLAAI